MQLLDPPLPEFQPDLTELSAQVALKKATGKADSQARRRLAAVRRWHEADPVHPLTTLDDGGVGRLMRIAAAKGRRVRPDLGLGVCGEHAGDHLSIRRLAAIGEDYVSCSPPRVPIACLDAGRAAVHSEMHATPESPRAPI